MKKHSTANILLVELVIVILFFLLCVSTLVEVLGAARVKSRAAHAENAALLRVENLENELMAVEDVSAGLERNQFSPEADRWVLRTEDYVLYAEMTEESQAAGTIRTLNFTAEMPGGEPLFELPSVKYVPGEVSP